MVEWCGAMWIVVVWGDGWGGRGGGVVEWCGVVVCWVVRDGGVVRVVRVVGVVGWWGG